VTRNGEGATHVRSISFEGEQGTLVMGAIGFLGSASPSTQASRAAAFVQRLRELGWIENRTVACSGKALVSQCAPEAPIGVTFRQKALRYQRTAQSVLNRAASRSVHAFHSRRPWRTPPSRPRASPRGQCVGVRSSGCPKARVHAMDSRLTRRRSFMMRGRPQRSGHRIQGLIDLVLAT
jgi:hypothetical protein